MVLKFVACPHQTCPWNNIMVGKEEIFKIVWHSGYYHHPLFSLAKGSKFYSGLMQLLSKLQRSQWVRDEFHIEISLKCEIHPLIDISHLLDVGLLFYSIDQILYFCDLEKWMKNELWCWKLLLPEISLKGFNGWQRRNTKVV